MNGLKPGQKAKKMKQESQSEIFLAVMERHKGILYKISNSYCRNADDRKDLIQEIFIQLWNSFQKYNDTYKHSTWIYRIALNTAISFYRKASKRENISNPLSEENLAFADIRDDIEAEDNFRVLEKFIFELKDFDKAMILLHLEEKSYAEIAEITGYSETNVATKISRIKTALQQKYSLLKQR